MSIESIQFSDKFKADVRKSILAIIFFIVTYLIILVLSLVLTAACILGGIVIIWNLGSFLGILLGAGLASLGLLVSFFLIKFLFTKKKMDRSNLHEISSAEETELFEIINEIVDKVGTKRPKKTYLSMDVNAAVFYDSSFWSMIFPVRKNLIIGLGLVNATTKSELKAIIAHEFGHFSQKSMKVGSYVYNVNHVIYNMLYDNDSFQNLINRWSSASGIISFFVAIAIKIIIGIQFLLQKLYGIVNKSYMSLSREMEFHADEVAANVTGYEPLRDGLLRLSFADYSLNSTYQYYGSKVADSIVSENLFEDQLTTLRFLAKDRGIPFENDLPKIDLQEMNRMNKSKLVVENQWASHPSTEVRIQKLEETGLEAESLDNARANEIFKDIDHLQKQLTKKLFSTISYKSRTSKISTEEFFNDYMEVHKKENFSKIYKSYYDQHNPSKFKLPRESAASDLTIEELFSSENIDLIYTMVALNSDIGDLEKISQKQYGIKTFDYDGIKYARRDARDLKSRLEKDSQNLKARVQKYDLIIYDFFHQLELGKSSSGNLEHFYQQFFDYDEGFQEQYEAYLALSEDLKFTMDSLPFEEISARFQEIYREEVYFKKEIRRLLKMEILEGEVPELVMQNFKSYLSRDMQYFHHETYREDNLDILNTAVNDYGALLSRVYFLLKKRILDYQESLLGVS